MAGRIPQQFIDELITRVDIVELINARVPLRKVGRNYTARCPFHDEKTPSFSVNPDKQFYHCFGCGASGTALGFLMDYDHLGFIDAVRDLASSVGMQMPQALDAKSDAGAPAINQSKDLYALLEQAASFYKRQLREHTQAPRAIEYLKGRGLSGDISRDFDIGYAPPGWDNLLRAFNAQANPALQAQLTEAGLVIEKGEKDRGGRSQHPASGGTRASLHSGYYDRFRDRIMFPIRDARGRVMGFGGRVLSADELPKYLNSPETPVFHKGRELYGLYEARKAVRQLDRLLVVEGYMDTVALAQFGIRYGVATLGTAITRDHLEKIFRLVPEVVFCFDGDRAGREAAWRAVQNALPLIQEGRQARFMFLPDGEDPDTLIRKEGQAGFEARIENSVPLSTFFYNQLTKQVDTLSMDGRARLVELVRPLLSNVPEGVFRHMMLERLAEITRRDVAVVAQEVTGRPITARRPDHHLGRRRSAAVAHAAGRSLVRVAIEILLYQPALAQQVDDPQALAKLDVAGADLLVELLELLRARPHLNTAALLEHWRDTQEGKYLAKLAQWQPEVPAGVEAELQGALRRLAEQYHQQRMENLLHTERLDGLDDLEKAELRRLLSSNAAKKTAE
jgi:DNA primase